MTVTTSTSLRPTLPGRAYTDPSTFDAERSRTGEARAFLNGCRHRGAPLCTEAAGVLVPTEHHIEAFHTWVRTQLGEIVAVPVSESEGAA